MQRLFNVRLVPNVLPETVQIVLVQTYEVASSEHEAIETLLLGVHVDMCDLGQKIQYFVIYGQQPATAEVKDLQVRKGRSDVKMKRKCTTVLSRLVHWCAGKVHAGWHPGQVRRSFDNFAPYTAVDEVFSVGGREGKGLQAGAVDL